jgi:hypothetical protein
MFTRIDRRCPPGLPLLSLLAGCGGGGGSLYNLTVGADSDGGVVFGQLDATAAPNVEVSIASSETRVCLGQCVALVPSARGGSPPYAYAWSPALTADGDAVEVCPRATTTYEVTATDDSSRAGELPLPGATASARVTLVVSPDCSDAGVPSGCDNLAASFVSTGSGANPVGPYLYDDTGLDAVICPTRGADGG